MEAPHLPMNGPAEYGLFQQWNVQISQFSRSVVPDSLQPHESQHARPPYPSPTPRVNANQNYHEISPHTGQTGHQQKSTNNKC